MKKIAIFGAPCNNDNLGCLALTYSLLNLLERISSKLDEMFIYYIYEGKPDQNKTNQIIKNLHLSDNQIQTYHLPAVLDPIRFIYHFKYNLPIIRSMSECELAIDMTQGDSFTDIYGVKRFQLNTNIKRLIEHLGIPLVLGPQTYGPFNDRKLEQKASIVIQNANSVIARDKLSSKYIKEITGLNADISCDLAFQLPYTCSKRQDNEMRIGINISGLLTSNKIESTTRNFTLKTDYDIFTEKILDYLNQKNNTVYLIPHVSADLQCIEFYHRKFPNTIVFDMFQTPMEAKTAISQMDFFIGARMHATIASISSGVPTLPISYSRKFKGVFDLIGYNHIIDLQKLDTDTAINQTIFALKNRDKLLQDVEYSVLQCEQYFGKMENIILNLL